VTKAKVYKNLWCGKLRVRLITVRTGLQHFTTCLGVRKIEIEDAIQATGSRDDGSDFLIVYRRYSYRWW